MIREDDFISRLMDETYEKIGHPDCELSNQSVVSLSDYFQEKEHGVLISKSSNGMTIPVAKLERYKCFLRLSIAGQNLDIPEGMNILESVESEEEQNLFKVEDKIFAKILSNISGIDVAYVLVQPKTSEASLLSEEPVKTEIKKAA
jgi:hypothetical protein